MVAPAYAAGPVQEMPFTAQLPESPGVFDAPSVSTKQCTINCSPLVVRWQEPSAGVNSSTGLLVLLPGGNPINDCTRPTQYGDPNWADTKNVIYCNVFYRNQAFTPPFDFGKLEMGDALRGVGALLARYPQVNKKRLYLYGASAGGLCTLQLLEATRGIWAEAHIFVAPTKITTRAEAQAKYPIDSFGDGFNDALKFPESKGNLTDWQWTRYQAERALRGPQNSLKVDLPARTTGSFPYIWVMYGTADEIVDIQHLYDLLSIVQGGTGVTAAHSNVVGGERWKIRDWIFYTVAGGHHDFYGGDTNVNSYVKATNYRVPDAFTRQRPTVPSLTVNYAFPYEFGWRIRVQGPLASATVTMEGPVSAADPEWKDVVELPNPQPKLESLDLVRAAVPQRQVGQPGTISW